MQTESVEGVEQPLRALVTRLRAEQDALEGIDKLLLLDIIELPSTPANAVLWSSTWRHVAGKEFGSVRGAMLIDDSGTGGIDGCASRTCSSSRSSATKTGERGFASSLDSRRTLVDTTMS